MRVYVRFALILIQFYAFTEITFMLSLPIHNTHVSASDSATVRLYLSINRLMLFFLSLYTPTLWLPLVGV